MFTNNMYHFFLPHGVYVCVVSGQFNITYNYLVTDASGRTTRVTAAVYEAGLFASTDVVDDVTGTGLSSANQLRVVVHGTHLAIVDSWLFGRALAHTYTLYNDGAQQRHDQGPSEGDAMTRLRHGP